MYISGKMIPVELFQEGREEDIKENLGRVKSSMIYFKNFCTCYNVPIPCTAIKKIIKIDMFIQTFY
jgi:hypothetical protein